VIVQLAAQSVKELTAKERITPSAVVFVAVARQHPCNDTGEYCTSEPEPAVVRMIAAVRRTPYSCSTTVTHLCAVCWPAHNIISGFGDVEWTTPMDNSRSTCDRARAAVTASRKLFVKGGFDCSERPLRRAVQALFHRSHMQCGL
jgi:hypothetical protein